MDDVAGGPGWHGHSAIGYIYIINSKRPSPYIIYNITHGIIYTCNQALFSETRRYLHEHSPHQMKVTCMKRPPGWPCTGISQLKMAQPKNKEELTNRIKSFVKSWFDDLQCGQVTLGNPIFARRFTTNEMFSRPVTIAVDCNPGPAHTTEKVKTQQGPLICTWHEWAQWF